MRKTNIIITVSLVAVLAGGSWYALNSVKTDKVRELARSGIPSLPDLSGATTELDQRLRKASTEVRESGDPTEALERLAMLYQANGYSEEAAQSLKILRELEPQNGRWPYLQARLSLEKRDPEELESLLTETVRLAPDYGPVYLRLGDLLSSLERFDEARGYYEKRLKLIPGDPMSQFSLAGLDAQGGNTEDAIKRLKSLLEKNPNLTQPNLMLADLLESTGDHEGAVEHLKIAQTPSPDWEEEDPWVEELNEYCFTPEFLIRLARNRVDAKLPKQALSFLEKAADLAPEDEHITAMLAIVYGLLDRTEDQQKLLEDGIRQAPKTSILYADLADFFIGQKQTEEAVTVIEDGLRESPERADLQEALGFAMRRANRPEDAIKAFQRATELDPERATSFFQLGRSLLQAGKVEEGKAAVHQAVEIEPEYSDALFALANFSLQEGKFLEGRNYTERLLKLNPNDTEVQGLYAAIFLQQGNKAFEAGDTVKAEQLYRDGLKAVPGYGSLYGAIGLLYAKAEQMDKAISEFEHYVTLSQTDRRAYLLLGNALAAVGRNDHAKQVYQAGIELARRAGDESAVSSFEKLIAKLAEPAATE